MARVVQPIAATVDAIGKLRDGEHGTYQPIKFASDQGDIWKNLPPAEASKLHKGQEVWLVPVGTRDGKPSHQIMLRHSQPVRNYASASEKKAIGCASSVTDEFLAPDQKHQIASWIAQQSSLYRFCYESALKSMADIPDLSAEDFRAIATTLYLSAMKKFDLED